MNPAALARAAGPGPAGIEPVGRGDRQKAHVAPVLRHQADGVDGFGRDVGLLAVTSADRLNAGWTAACRARERGRVHARSHIERLMAGLPPHCGIVSVLDGHPATLAWLGAVHGHGVRSLGVEHFGQTGSIPDLYRHYGIDANAIIAAAQAIAPGGPIRYLGVA